MRHQRGGRSFDRLSSRRRAQATIANNGGSARSSKLPIQGGAKRPGTGTNSAVTITARTINPPSPVVMPGGGRVAKGRGVVEMTWKVTVFRNGIHHEGTKDTESEARIWIKVI